MKLLITLSIAFALVAFALGPDYLSLPRSVLTAVGCGAFAFVVLAGFRVLFRKISLRCALGISVGMLTGIFIYLAVLTILNSFPIAGHLLPHVKAGIFLLLVCIGAVIGYDKTSLAAAASDSFFKQPEALAPKILDTSVIIDGRIADIAETGFLQGELIIPKFIIQELQHIADSPDPARKTRGRRGLDIITRMQKEMPLIRVTLTDHDFEHIKDADIKLIELSKKLNGILITNDYNLKKIADLEKVTVLNINNLNHALKPVVEQGQTIRINLVKPGKEQHQAVGYLDDGTMVVTDNASRQIGKDVDISVRSMVQTPTGRIVFAKLKKEG